MSMTNEELEVELKELKAELRARDPLTQNAILMAYTLGNIARMAVELRKDEATIIRQRKLDTIIKVAEMAVNPVMRVMS